MSEKFKNFPIISAHRNCISGGIKPAAWLRSLCKAEQYYAFYFIVFESKKHRDEVNKKVMDEMNEKFKDVKDFSMPFDMQRFTYGGFEVAVEG